MSKRRLNEEWIRVGVRAPRNGKLLKVTPAARWLWLAATCHCREHQTDGRFGREVVETLGVPKPWPLVASLVAARLFEEDGEDYRVHDYALWQETKAEVEERREEVRERVAQLRQKRAGNE